MNWEDAELEEMKYYGELEETDEKEMRKLIMEKIRNLVKEVSIIDDWNHIGIFLDIKVNEEITLRYKFYYDFFEEITPFKKNIIKYSEIEDVQDLESVYKIAKKWRDFNFEIFSP